MQRVVITGSNRGIGLGLTRAYLHRGDQVFACCRNPETATELNALQQEFTTLHVIPLEVTSPASIDLAAAVVKGFTGGIDILINNAGVGGGTEHIGALTEEDLVNIFRVNSVAPILITQAFMALLESGKNARIVHISSKMGSIADNGSGGYYGYRASKAALNMLNSCLSIDLGKKIISIVINPGWVRTDMGGQGATLDVETSTEGIVNVVDHLAPKDSGRFLEWNGDEIPW